jgi:hypothetical protein
MTRLAWKEIAESLQYLAKILIFNILKNSLSFKVSNLESMTLAIESVKDEMIIYKVLKSVPKYNFSVTELYGL